MSEQLVENLIMVAAGGGVLILLARAVLRFIYSHVPSFPEDDGESM